MKLNNFYFFRSIKKDSIKNYTSKDYPILATHGGEFLIVDDTALTLKDAEHSHPAKIIHGCQR